MQALVSCVDQLRRQIGHGDINHDPDDAGSSIASFIVSKGADTEWPLTPILEIPGIEGVIEEALHPSMPLDIPRSPDPIPVIAGTTKTDFQETFGTFPVLVPMISANKS